MPLPVARLSLVDAFSRRGGSVVKVVGTVVTIPFGVVIGNISALSLLMASLQYPVVVPVDISRDVLSCKCTFACQEHPSHPFSWRADSA